MPDLRRKHQRKKLHLAVEAVTSNHILLGTTKDISRGGMGVELDGPIMEQEVSIGLFRVVDGIEDDSPSVAIDCEVMWGKVMEPGRFTFGLRFLELTAEQERYIASLLEE